MTKKLRKDGEILYKNRSELTQRINVQKQYAKYDVNDWILNKLNIHKGEYILDIGCGNGNQLIPYSLFSNNIFGVDLSFSLLLEAKRRKNDLRLVWNSGEELPFKSNIFDIVTCNYAIYYMDVRKVLQEIKKVLKINGRFLIVSPTEDNAKELLDIHCSVINYIPDVYIFGLSSLRDEVIPFSKEIFGEIKYDEFENPLIFPTVASFLAYYESTTLYMKSKSKMRDLLTKIRIEAGRILNTNGEIVVTKKVGGVVGYKR